MADEKYLDKYETELYETLNLHLRYKDKIDQIFPDAPDIEDLWENIAQSYLQDGVREFTSYHTASLGWMMYIGLSIAQMWDEDWDKCSKTLDIYTELRDKRGYDCMDEHISEDILHFTPDQSAALSKLVSDVASMAYRKLTGSNFENGTSEAFHAYVRTLHVLYQMGAAVQLKELGYHMTKM